MERWPWSLETKIQAPETPLTNCGPFKFFQPDLLKCTLDMIIQITHYLWCGLSEGIYRKKVKKCLLGTATDTCPLAILQRGEQMGSYNWAQHTVTQSR